MDEPQHFMLRVKMPPDLIEEFDLARATYAQAHPELEDVTRSFLVRQLMRQFIAGEGTTIPSPPAEVAPARITPKAASKKDAYLQSLKEQS